MYYEFITTNKYRIPQTLSMFIYIVHIMLEKNKGKNINETIINNITKNLLKICG
jgi:hypothetical protein